MESETIKEKAGGGPKGPPLEGSGSPITAEEMLLDAYYGGNFCIQSEV
jgi:hypothetical protein